MRRVRFEKDFLDKQIGDIDYVNNEEYKILKKNEIADDYTSPSERKAILISNLEDTFNQIMKAIKEQHYEKAKSFLSHSGSGDAYGQDNYYIDLSHIIAKESYYQTEDIGDFIEILEELDREEEMEK